MSTVSAVGNVVESASDKFRKTREEGKGKMVRVRKLKTINKRMAKRLTFVARGATVSGGGIGWTSAEIASKEARARITDWFKRRLENPLVSVFVAEHLHNRKVIGSVQLVRHDPFHSAAARHRAVVTKLCVLPECRGQGAGRHLMEALIKAAKEEGLQQLALDVRLTANQAKARRIYSGLGFVEFGRLPNYAIVDGKACDGLYMVLDLTI